VRKTPGIADAVPVSSVKGDGHLATRRNMRTGGARH